VEKYEVAKRIKLSNQEEKEEALIDRQTYSQKNEKVSLLLIIRIPTLRRLSQ
jgi:hypothetical protein